MWKIVFKGYSRRFVSFNHSFLGNVLLIIALIIWNRIDHAWDHAFYFFYQIKNQETTKQLFTSYYYYIFFIFTAMRKINKSISMRKPISSNDKLTRFHRETCFRAAFSTISRCLLVCCWTRSTVPSVQKWKCTRL